MKPITISKKIALVVLAVSIATVNISVAHASTPGIDINNLISSLLTNPTFLMTFVIEFALGLGLGYFSAKVFKYILALIGIFIVGVLLNVWQSPQLGANITAQLTQLGLTWDKIQPVALSLLYTLGITTVMPITIGFAIGIVIAIAK